MKFHIVIGETIPEYFRGRNPGNPGLCRCRELPALYQTEIYMWKLSP